MVGGSDESSGDPLHSVAELSTAQSSSAGAAIGAPVKLLDDTEPETADHGSDNDSDAEVERLLSSKVPGTHTEAQSKPISSEARSVQPSHTAARSSGKAKTLAGKVFGRMSSSDKRMLAREMLVEILPILLLSLVGAIVTGMLLDKMQTWRVFVRIEELFILVPILLNLKGNLGKSELF
ncbi:hypothetical protein OIV83_001371 [Microbotryomycetes sp. JL201]|nr:hypothetical protein OIV83_001371 [Microbotryomycetes sp. JL201]